MMKEVTPALQKLLNKKDLVSNIRMLISDQCGIAVEYITLNSNLSDDLGLDWLDVIELTVLIEKQFPNLAVSDDGPVASLEDLIRNIRLRDSDALAYTEQYVHSRLAL
jgi:acyl carrier protein